MLLKLLAVFIVVPLVELALLLYLADLTDWRFALGLVIVTGVVGSLLAKSQGWRVLARMRRDLAEGRLPAEPLLDALLIFVAGALLLTPGMLTDLVGISLLIPWSRTYYRRRVVQWCKSRFTIHTSGFGDWRMQDPKSEVIDSYVIERSPDGSEKRLDSP